MSESRGGTDAERESVIEEIRAAFDGVQRGSGITLHEADVLDMYGSDRERAKARRRDTERRWQDVPDAEIEEENSSLSFMDAEGSRYYIPVYMIWTLRNYRQTESVSAEHTIGLFSHEAIAKDRRFDLLNAEQRRAVARFLRYFVDHEPDLPDSYWAEIGLRQGWGKYLRRSP